MMKETLLSIRARLPTHHPCRRDRHPINPTRLVGTIASDLLKALTTENLTLSGDMVLSLETIGLRAVTGLLEDRPRYAKVCIISELPQQEFHMILIERDICVQIADDF